MMHRTVRRTADTDVDELIAVFRASRAAAMPWLPVLHTPDEDRAYFEGQVDAGPSWVAVDDSSILGFAICSPGWLDHLYVRPDARGTGVGRALLVEAKQSSPTGLDLWVFERNLPARRFYAREGFWEVLATDGQGNEEREPDILMRWPGERLPKHVI